MCGLVPLQRSPHDKPWFDSQGPLREPCDGVNLSPTRARPRAWFLPTKGSTQAVRVPLLGLSPPPGPKFACHDLRVERVQTPRVGGREHPAVPCMSSLPGQGLAQVLGECT